VSDNESVISDIEQFDGNVSLRSNEEELSHNFRPTRPSTKYRQNNASVAHHLPVVTVCNMRSLFPKIENFKTDFFERQVDVSLCCEVWEKAENKKHKDEMEKMLELEGLKYFSTTRPRGKRGGGAAIIVNTDKFKVEKLEIQIPHHLEIVWALAKPKHEEAQFKRIILCSFYSPPRSRLRNKLKDHIIGTLQILTTKYDGCGLFVGGDKNKMDISSLLNTNLKLKQIVTRPTRRKEILDVCLTNLFSYYNAPIIVPPVQPDVPGQGVPSDHSVPLCVPHTDPCNPPTREYRTVISRPLPDSKIRDFGQWITVQSWDEIKVKDEPAKQVTDFERIMTQKLDQYFPKKITKLGVGDKPYMTSELKTLKRRRMREYREKGKSVKYERLKAEFDQKLEKAATKFLRKNVDSLKESNPGQAYNILKKMGAQPGECDDGSNFTLPSHENLTPMESAEKIAEHFSKISREFPPLNMETLPERVRQKLVSPESESKIPLIMEHEVFSRIKSANKPKSGVPGDLPRKLVTEFGPELATPVCKIFNSIVNSAKQGAAKWPTTWKLEFGTPLQKIPEPGTEDDLRIISLTSFFSKVMEKFVVEWLMFYIGEKLDPKQFGGLKGNSISHYMIELINFILYNQDYNLPIAVLICAIDFSKAFNRQNHNILVTKLSDMGVPGWLLNIVMGFLSERVMVVRFKGETTDTKSLPGGGPQGTLLGLLLFLVLINLCGYDNQQSIIGETITNPKKKFTPSSFHSKYVDDLTVAEALNMKESLVPNPDRTLPDPYHARLGQKLEPEKSQVYGQLHKIQDYALENDMKLNFSKTKFMLFNPTQNYDFVPDFEVEASGVQTMEEMKLLGLVVRNDLSWKSNTENMIKKAYNRLWMVKRLKTKGANQEDLTDIFVKQVRSVLEFGAPVWNSSLTQDEGANIERVQKSFLHITLGSNYNNYETALAITNLETLEARRTKLCLNFAVKATKHPKHKDWFVPNCPPGPKTRSEKVQFKPPICRLSRFKKSPIPYLTNLLNNRSTS
jgi:hypothetical protein